MAGLLDRQSSLRLMLMILCISPRDIHNLNHTLAFSRYDPPEICSIVLLHKRANEIRYGVSTKVRPLKASGFRLLNPMGPPVSCYQQRRFLMSI